MPFIVFEGGEAVGKTTQISILLEHLSGFPGVQTESTREPGGTPLAEAVRQLFKSKNLNDEPLPVTEAFLVMAARAQHVRTRLKPALALGRWVICDRYLDSSYVYQHFAGGLPKADIDKLAELAIDDLVPDLTIVLHAAPEVAAQRMAARPQERSVAPAHQHLVHAKGTDTCESGDRLDTKCGAFHSALHDGFLKLTREQWSYPNGIVPHRVLIDSAPAAHVVAQQVRDALHATFPELVRRQGQ